MINKLYSKIYLKIDEAAQILETDVNSLLHYGAIKKIEILGKTPKNEETIHIFTNFSYINENKEQISCTEHHWRNPDFIVIDPYNLYLLEMGSDSSAGGTGKVYFLTDSNFDHIESETPETFITYHIEALIGTHLSKAVEIKYISPWFNFLCHNHDEETEINNYEYNITLDNLYVMASELQGFIKSQTEPIPEPQEIKDLNPTERDALHNIIKALANMVIDPTAPKEKEKSDEQRGKPPFKNQTQLIEFLSDKESGLGEWRGLSKPNLEKVFAKANKTDSP